MATSAPTKALTHEAPAAYAYSSDDNIKKLSPDAKNALEKVRNQAKFPSSEEKVIVQLWANPFTNKIHTSTTVYSFDPRVKAGLFKLFEKDTWNIKALHSKELTADAKILDRQNIEFIRRTFEYENVTPLEERQGGEATHLEILVDKKESSVNSSEDFVDIRLVGESAKAQKSVEVTHGEFNSVRYDAKTKELMQPNTETFGVESLMLKEQVWGPSQIQYLVRKDQNYKRIQDIVLHMFNNIGKADASVSFDYKAAFFFNQTHHCPFTGDELNHSNAVQVNIFEYHHNGETYPWLTVSRQGVRAFLTSNLSQFPNLPVNAIRSDAFTKKHIRAISENSMTDGHMTSDYYRGNDAIAVYAKYRY